MLGGDFAWWWRAHRWLRPLPRRRVWRSALAAFMIAQIGGLALVLGSRVNPGLQELVLARPFVAFVYVWHLLVLLPLLLCWAAAGVGTGVVAAARWIVRLRKPAPPLLVADGLSRREFLGAAAAIAPAVLTFGTSAVAVPQLTRFRVRRMELPLADLPPALDGMTIAHVTDIHVGRFTHGSVLEDIVRTTNDLRADLVLMTGDLINFSLSDLPVALDVAKNLRGTHGVFMCEGNHDLIENGAEFERRTKDAGVPLLINESTSVKVRGAAVQLLGLRWGGPFNGRGGDLGIAASARELLAQREAGAFPILLAHHPHAFDFAGGIPLTLAGHTHGGQIMFTETTGFGPWMFRYWSGVYESAGRKLVVSNGVGNWFPLRTWAPAEIVHLTLRRHSTAG
jgi:predicted MPP superfamily phosphohydrolase